MVQNSSKGRFLLLLLIVAGTILPFGGVLMAGELTGSWGGNHIRLVVKGNMALVEFDCAAGTIDGPLETNEQGNFALQGSYLSENGGPIRQGELPRKGQTALYRGWTNGTEMRLTVTLTPSGRDLGPFSLGRGRRANLDKCL